MTVDTNARPLHAHEIDKFNRDHIAVDRTSALGDPAIEGREYMVRVFDEGSSTGTILRFQTLQGLDSTITCVSDEALLAIVIDRLECFNRGPTKCRESSLAITNLEQAMHWLRARAIDRERRGVTGQRVP